MPFVAKCYNGHRIVLEDELEGETVECPICEEDFIASSDFEELGKVEEERVPYNALGFIHMGLGLLIGVFLTFLADSLRGPLRVAFWSYIMYLTIVVGLIYFIRGFIELFFSLDILTRPKRAFFAAYYITLKKVKFYRK